MVRFLVKRILSSLVALFIFLTLIFFAAQIIIPTDFTTQFAMFMNREAREQLAEDLGIDQPLWEQYLNYMSMILRGRLGDSFYGYPVIDALKALLPYTMLLFLTGTLIAFSFGQWLGKVTAWLGPGLMPGLIGGSATLSSVVLYTAFPPWIAFLMTYFMARRLNLFRRPRTANPFEDAQGGVGVWQDFHLSPQTVMWYMVLIFVAAWILVMLIRFLLRRKTGIRLSPLVQIPLFALLIYGAWALLGFLPQAKDILSVASLPLITYILLSFGETMLIMRTSMMDTITEDYVTTAQAKGLPSHVVRDKHAARNALLPVFSRLVISLPYLLTGMMIIEDVLGWPGISAALLDSMYNQDIPMVMGGLLLVGVLAAVARLILDILYAYLDPRIRYDTDASGNLGRG